MLSAALFIVTISCACCQTKSEPTSPEGNMTRKGQRVSIVGVARDAKLGAVVVTGNGMVWIDGLDTWPERFVGRRVRVGGVLAVRADLPVFVRKEGEPEKSGIPVSSQEEVAEARKRTVLTDARWELLPE